MMIHPGGSHARPCARAPCAETRSPNRSQRGARELTRALMSQAGPCACAPSAETRSPNQSQRGARTRAHVCVCVVCVYARSSGAR